MEGLQEFSCGGRGQLTVQAPVRAFIFFLIVLKITLMFIFVTTNKQQQLSILDSNIQRVYCHVPCKETCFSVAYNEILSSLFPKGAE